MIIITAILALVLTDVLIKSYIEKKPSHFFPRALMKGKITLHKSFNEGMMMGLGKQYPLAVKWIPAVLIPILTCFYIPYFIQKGNLLVKLSGILTISGGTGNLCDRLLKGRVTDYFSLPFKKIKHIIFNLSDMYIFIGCILLLLYELLRDLPARS